MSTNTHDDNVTSWRDLVDALTPHQIAELEYCEREQIPPGLATPTHQLNCARKMAEHNIIQSLCAGIAAPFDVVGEVDDWEEWDDGAYKRGFTAWNDPAGLSSIYGMQSDDGRIERSILCDVDGGGVTAEHARRLAAALLDAADELEQRA